MSARVTFDGVWSPQFSDVVACEPVFAWLPVRLWNNQRVWLRRVYKIHAYKHQYLRGGPDWSVHYSLQIPANAL